MIMPTANRALEQQTADSHDAEKNIFSAEPRNDGKRRVESCDKSKIGRNGSDLCIGEATLDNSQEDP